MTPDPYRTQVRGGLEGKPDCLMSSTPTQHTTPTLFTALRFLLRRTFSQSLVLSAVSWAYRGLAAGLFTVACISQIWDADTWDRLFMLRAESSLWKQTGCLLLFGNTFLCLSASFSYERFMTWRALKTGGRLESVHLILSKHRPPPLWEADKQSDIHTDTHTHTHSYAYIHSEAPVWFGIAQISHREQERSKTFQDKWPFLGNSADWDMWCHCGLGRENLPVHMWPSQV